MEYGIRIQNTTTNAEELLLTLNPAEQEQRTDCVGYDDYDAASNTYTWIVSGRVDSIYALSEQNYLLQDVPSTSYYRISDMAKPGDWQNYDADSQPTTAMVSYATDTPKNRYRTVSFRNKYVDAGTLTLRKFDSFTHNGIANGNFCLPQMTALAASICTASRERACIPTPAPPVRNIPKRRGTES